MITNYDTITVNADTTLEIPAGRTLTISNIAFSGITVNAGKTLTITGDSVLDIKNRQTGASMGINNSGTVELASGTVIIENTSGYGIHNASGASLTIDGAAVEIKTSETMSGTGIHNLGTVILHSGKGSLGAAGRNRRHQWQRRQACAEEYHRQI
ncbi:MAG TPA: hypothetical protein VN381_07995 [Anaerovoracaceae bacterium]|nr:hypothetical protein [Anaerovoracaceae bacterium]